MFKFFRVRQSSLGTARPAAGRSGRLLNISRAALYPAL
jgi:hypothetical protein